MSLLLKILRFILLCGQDDDERLLTRHEAPPYLRRPLSQATTSPAVSHSYPTFDSPSRSSTFLSSVGRSTHPPPARPPPVSYSSSASANTSSSTATLPSASRSTQPPVSFSSSASANTSISSATPPSASRSTQPPPARPPPVSYSSSALTNTSSSRTTSPSASRSTQPPPARPPPVPYSSSASANPLTAPIPSPLPAQSTKPQDVAHPSPALANQSKSTLPSKSSLFLGQSTRLPTVAQSSPSLANSSTTTLPSRAAASPVPSTRAQLAKPPSEAHSSPSSYNTSSTTPSQSRAHSSLAPTSEPSLQFLNNWKPKQVVLPSPETSHTLKTWKPKLAVVTSPRDSLPLKIWKPVQPPELLETKPKGTAREESPPIDLVNPSSTFLQKKPVNRNTSIKHSKSVLPRYEIPQRLKEMIERDIVPPVLLGPLTPSTYADYFACLLYAEDYYIEKWSDFLLSEVTLELRSRAAFQNARGIKSEKKYHMNEKDFVAFKIDSVPERLPFLLSRDFVFVRPSVEMAEPFKGVLYRVIKGVVLVEFEDDFHAQHSSTKKYDVNFSFNRVCLKRAHHAVSAAKDPSLSNILFPEGRFTLSFSDLPTSSRILNHKGPLPYLLEGPLSTALSGQLSNAGYVIHDAILQIYRAVPHCRILICAPRNRTCDALMRSLQKEIPQSKLFRANAAFRDYELVPDDIIPACLYEGECFTCPPLNELRNFKVVMSTFMSSFRLHNAGITSDHFTHIFLVDASSVTEPEAIVALVDLVCNETAVVVTGSSTDSPHLMRSDIGRKHGLKSYFKRLLEREPYSRRDPKFIAHL